MLKVYVINVGHGDSIAIRFPNGYWGLIDCNIPSVKEGNRVLDFLAKNKPADEPLYFICLTHFDHDHFNGLLEIYIRYQKEIKYFIDPGEEYYSAAVTMTYDGEKDRAICRELNFLYSLLSQARKKNRLTGRFTLLKGREHIPFPKIDDKVQIKILCPGNEELNNINDTIKYQRRIKRGLSDFLPGDLNVELFKDFLKNDSKINSLIIKELGVSFEAIDTIDEFSLIDVLNSILERFDFYRVIVDQINRDDLRDDVKIILHRASSGDETLSAQEYRNLNRALIEIAYSSSIRRKLKSTEGSTSIGFNMISLGLLILYGDSKLLLCGDAKTRTLQRIISENKMEKDLALVKVSHHGSKEGHCLELWQNYIRPQECFAVVSGNGSKYQPHQDVLRDLTNNAKVYCTNSSVHCEKVESEKSLLRESVEDLRNVSFLNSTVAEVNDYNKESLNCDKTMAISFDINNGGIVSLTSENIDCSHLPFV